MSCVICAFREKVLADWNGYWVAALAKAAGSAVTAEPAVRAAWRAEAETTARFILEGMRNKDGELQHRWRRGRVGMPGQLDDHAYLIWGLLELAATGDGAHWLSVARDLQSRQEQRSSVSADGVYRMSDAVDLPVAPIEVADGAMPSGNAVSLHNLVRLGRLLGDPYTWRLALSPGDDLPLALAGLVIPDGKPAAFLCENFTCRAPITDPIELEKALLRR